MCSFLAVRPWTSYLTSPSLHFFPYKLQRACHHRVPIRAEEGLEELPQHSAGHTIIVSLFLSPPS